jgi:hypothetical protein
MPESEASSQNDVSALRIAVYLGCGALLLALIAYNFVDIDIWHQMNLVRASLAAGHLLTEDPFAYTPTVHPMIDHEWGAGVLAFFFGNWMGGAGILLLKFGSAFGTLFLAMRVAQRRGVATAVLGFMVPLGIGLLYLGFLSAVRAQAYSFVFTAALLWALEAADRGDRCWLWVCLAMFPIWVNLHAGFVVGLGFVFLYCVERAVLLKPSRPRIIVSSMMVLSVMVLEVFLNPYGSNYFHYLSRALTMERPRIMEWSPLWTLGWGPTFLFAAVLGALLYAFVKTKTWRISGVLLLAATAIEAILHRKMLPFFAITWICYVPAYLQKTAAGEWLQRFAQKRDRFLVLGWTALIAVCLVSAVRLKFWKAEVPQDAGDLSYPVGAADYLAARQFHGNVMVPFRAGAYVSWKLYPNAKVSLDSRYEVAYPNDWVERVFRFYEARQGTNEDWRETLNAYPTDLVLAPRNAPVLPLLHELNWKPVYKDAQFELAARPGLQLPIEDHGAESLAGSFP